MTHPTKEEVLNLKAFWWNRPLVMRLCDAYLALMEEVERKNRLIKMQDEFITDKSKVAAIRGTRIEQLDMAIASLQADNEGLRALANEIVVYAGLYEDTYLDTHFLPILQKAKELV